jgi:hypothetical protein
MTGTYNTASGTGAFYSNTTGFGNTASGAYALYLNTTGSYNTASGSGVLYYNTTGYNNTASGYYALLYNTTGNSNTANGYSALVSNTTGTGNTAIGEYAGAQTTGNNNTYIGYNVQGVAGESNVIRIGPGGGGTYIGGIYGATSASGSAVYVNSSGKLGTTTSSRRFKEDIQDMGDLTDGLMRLRPVTFHYKPEYAEGSRLRQYGLIAEEVSAVYPDLVSYNDKGEMNSVYYQFVNAMLLNEVQKQHRKIEALEERLERLEKLLGGNNL